MKATKDLLWRIKDGIDNILSKDKNWSYSFNEIDGAERVYAISPFNVQDALNIHDVDKYDLFDILCRNRKKFTTNEDYPNTSDYDCTGDVSSNTVSLEKTQYLLFLIQSWRYDV